MVISDETETGKSAGMSYAALREVRFSNILIL